MQKKIIVTGSKGQLGTELRQLAPVYPSFQFFFFDRDELEITDEAALEHLFAVHQPDYVINCAAYTAVDKAESEKDLAKNINGTAVGKLASLCRIYQTRFIHFSTDYVFNGSQTRPLLETDPLDPVNYYGETKLSGEQLALQNHPDSIIIRTSWVYSSFGNNFVKTMVRMMRAKESVRVVDDQYGSPTYAADLAEATMAIIQNEEWISGIYHYCNQGMVSWFDFAVAIRNLGGFPCQVDPIPTEQYPTPAKRPAYSVLDTNKIQRVYGIRLKDWQESLHACMQKLNV